MTKAIAAKTTTKTVAAKAVKAVAARITAPKKVTAPAKGVEVFVGNAAKLAETVTLNGKALSQPFISQLVTYGVGAKLTGNKLPNGTGRGKPSYELTLTNSKGMRFCAR